MFETNLQVGEIRLFVEESRLETERVNDIADLARTLLKSLLSLLGGRVGALKYLLASDPNFYKLGHATSLPHRQTVPQSRETNVLVDSACSGTKSFTWLTVCVELADHDIGGM